MIGSFSMLHALHAGTSDAAGCCAPSSGTSALLRMAKVLQQRCVPSNTVQQSFTPHGFRTSEVNATQPVDQTATCNGSPISSSYLQSATDGESPLPTFDLSLMLGPQADRSSDRVQQLCRAVANCLRETGCLVVRDPRVKAEDNKAFLDMMERYFAQSTAAKLKDTRPELHFQVGATPEGTETPKCTVDPTSIAAIASQPEEHRARTPKGADPKWRYMWRIGERPAQTQYTELNAEPVVPADFPEWAEVMTTWGDKMLAAVHTVAQMSAVGFGLPAGAFTERMAHGPHLLAPTGADLDVHNTLNMCYAGYHYDLNFLTIHGKSRFPGLFVWLRNGRRVAVKIPAGCLFIQAGKQLEWLTAGFVKAGMHEVVCSEDTLLALNKAKAEGSSTWRVSSTVFGHIASDQVLTPLGHFATAQATQEYPAVDAGKFVQHELEAIKLKQR